MVTLIKLKTNDTIYSFNVETYSTNRYEWCDEINENGHPYYERFRVLFEEMSEDELKTIYKHFRITPQTVYFSNVSKNFQKFKKNQRGEKPSIKEKMPIETIIELLAYTIIIIIDRSVQNYKNNINHYFGWQFECIVTLFLLGLNNAYKIHKCHSHQYCV